LFGLADADAADREHAAEPVAHQRDLAPV